MTVLHYQTIIVSLECSYDMHYNSNTESESFRAKYLRKVAKTETVTPSGANQQDQT